ncbi:hypothetical protein MATL_G00063810 [Megalops atlanticus]|uniref:Mitochondrial ribosomal protein S36 n=1 Tax=Megalops atlanticus TaxID=7932 RepID=A0A9D3Q9W8_MEGAT|nr:hypothetical protein MATL_G00063810 [Megalops atlanticus]
MGSKISGKMAAAGRVVQVVRPHAPLIKFPNRQSMPRPKVQEALKLAAASAPPASPAALSSVASSASTARPPGLISRLPGPPDSVSIVRDLPQRYRRRLLAMEEMDYIQRGGPE